MKTFAWILLLFAGMPVASMAAISPGSVAILYNSAVPESRGGNINRCAESGYVPPCLSVPVPRPRPFFLAPRRSPIVARILLLVLSGRDHTGAPRPFADRLLVLGFCMAGGARTCKRVSCNGVAAMLPL